MRILSRMLRSTSSNSLAQDSSIRTHVCTMPPSRSRTGRLGAHMSTYSLILKHGHFAHTPNPKLSHFARTRNLKFASPAHGPSYSHQVTWNSERVATNCRERCGGQGYLAANRFGEAIGGSHAGMTVCFCDSASAFWTVFLLWRSVTGKEAGKKGGVVVVVVVLCMYGCVCVWGGEGGGGGRRGEGRL